MLLLDNKAAVVTGAAQGIGLAVARTFIDHGAAVLIADVNQPAAEAAAKELSQKGGRCLAQACDVTVEADMQALVDRCVRELGALDVMVNNAGITRDASMRNMTLQDFRTVIDVHLQGTWLG